MMVQNLNHNKLRLNAVGVIDGPENSDTEAATKVLVAYDCTLRAFEEVDRNGENFWNATLVVPMQPQALDIQPTVTQEDAWAKYYPTAFQNQLDAMWNDGARFELDHYVGQEPKQPPSSVAPAGVNPNGVDLRPIPLEK